MHLHQRLVASVASAALAGVALAGVALTGSSAGASLSAHRDPNPDTLRFHVVFSPFSYTDLGEPGVSAGDVIVFHDQLTIKGASVGDEVGSCVVVDATGLSNCTGVIQLTGRGTIAFAFVNSPPPHKALAVTGGSGRFRNVSGHGFLDENEDQTGTLVLHVAP